ncbi:efflux RND transporter periplasmic adaptor subunit [Formosa sediminum]|uniref:Efflux RND transporter periplasmic adaptor subunit n=1 Tax=Formosa sediminum TaxID=2594004 RepID=A0A516GR91_9FLAO|nr:efflux RND transporter periplasmic adaptor subunit [Formosa sediminum]QDO94023.1 efflux RND transporter periplasmic adaptor subunit [Formosa sediminum]
MRLNPYHSVLSIFIFTTFIILTSCKSKEEENKPSKETPISVEVLKIEKETITNTISLSGNVEANTTIRLGFMVAGKIQYIAINEGESIKKGALLASLDDSDYQIGLKAANGKLLEVQDKYNRLKIMHERNSLSDADFIKIKAGLEQAEANKELQAKNIYHTKIYAPISGVLLKKGVSEGEVIDKGMPIFGLGDIDTVKINAAVPGDEINSIKLNQDATVNIYALDTIYKGKVIEVGLAAEAKTRTYNAKIEIDNPNHKILPGMIAQIDINSNKKEHKILVPGHAILKDTDNKSYVYIVDEKTNKVFKRDISIGKLHQNNIEITSGLNANEIIVTSGIQNLNNGSLVNFN